MNQTQNDSKSTRTRIWDDCDKKWHGVNQTRIWDNCDIKWPDWKQPGLNPTLTWPETRKWSNAGQPETWPNRRQHKTRDGQKPNDLRSDLNQLKMTQDPRMIWSRLTQNPTQNDRDTTMIQSQTDLLRTIATSRLRLKDHWFQPKEIPINHKPNPNSRQTQGKFRGLTGVSW